MKPKEHQTGRFESPIANYSTNAAPNIQLDPLEGRYKIVESFLNIYLIAILFFCFKFEAQDI